VWAFGMEWWNKAGLIRLRRLWTRTLGRRGM